MSCDMTQPKTFLLAEMSFKIAENGNTEKTSRDLMLMIAKPSEVPTNNIGPDFNISALTKKNKDILFSTCRA